MTCDSDRRSRAASVVRYGCGTCVPTWNVRCWRPSSHTAMQPRVSIGRWVWRCCEKVLSTTRCASRMRACTIAMVGVLVRQQVGQQLLVHARRCRASSACHIEVDRGQHLVVHRHLLRRVLGHVAVAARSRRRPGRPGSGPCRWAACPSRPAASPRSAGAMRCRVVQAARSLPVTTATTPGISQRRLRCRWPRCGHARAASARNRHAARPAPRCRPR